MAFAPVQRSAGESEPAETRPAILVMGKRDRKVKRNRLTRASEALSELGLAFRTILFDIASNARSFESFREEAQKFSEETSAPALHDWEEAVRQVRAGQLDADWLVSGAGTKPTQGVGTCDTDSGKNDWQKPSEIA